MLLQSSEKTWHPPTSAIFPLEERMPYKAFFETEPKNPWNFTLPLVFLQQLAVALTVKQVGVAKTLTSYQHISILRHNLSA